jgi:hypothetical protein
MDFQRRMALSLTSTSRDIHQNLSDRSWCSHVTFPNGNLIPRIINKPISGFTLLKTGVPGLNHQITPVTNNFLSKSTISCVHRIFYFGSRLSIIHLLPDFYTKGTVDTKILILIFLICNLPVAAS